MRNASPIPTKARAQGADAQISRAPVSPPQGSARPASIFTKGDAAATRLKPGATNDCSPQIFVADDNAAIREIILTILRVAGFAARGVNNGADAIEAVRQGDCDLVLMDIEMPTMNGLDATRAIRALTWAKRRVPIIAFTGNATPADQERFYQAGMNDFATKPIAANELIALIEHWTNGTPSAMEKRQSEPPLLEPSTLADLEAVIGPGSMIDLLILFDETAGTHADAIRRAAKDRNAGALSKMPITSKALPAIAAFPSSAAMPPPSRRPARETHLRSRSHLPVTWTRSLPNRASS